MSDYSSITKIVDGWFGTDTTDFGSSNTSPYDASNFDLAGDTNQSSPYDSGNFDLTGGTDTSPYDVGSHSLNDYNLDIMFDTTPNSWNTDYDDDSIWGTVKEVGSAVGDFLNTKAGTQMTTAALGMLGKYLMDDDASGAAQRRYSTASMMGGGGGAAGSGGGTVEATTSKLGQW